MASCNECIHYDACMEIYQIFTKDTKPYTFTNVCELYKHTADVVEVKHGEWIIKRDEYDNEYMMCSCCKEEFYPADEDTVDTTPNYCMNCGAKMGGDAR